MKIVRRHTREIKIGGLKIGAHNPIIVQSMLKNKLSDPSAVKREIIDLQDEGCEIIRSAVVDVDDLESLVRIKSSDYLEVPLVADIHFKWSLAFRCLEKGIDCVRINPGNIGSYEKVAKILDMAKKKNAAIRIGVNSGSIEKNILRKNKGNIVNSIIESVSDNVRFFENAGFHNFKISAKASSVSDTIDINQSLSDKFDYPLHIGITESGTRFEGGIKSGVGIGVLLSRGIGDTIRVSLTDRSFFEVRAAFSILDSLGLREARTEIISCPTCGRTMVDLKSFVEGIGDIAIKRKGKTKIAIMGCIVNGPGEAKEADIGIAFGRKNAAIFKKGVIIEKSPIKIAYEKFKEELSRG